jgi:hypothetical protein
VTGQVSPVVFPNRSGHRLFGMLHPSRIGEPRETGVILLSPGIKSRIAPHRLYVKLADRFTGMGFSVFRFDYHGLGDSEGEVHERNLADFYGSIQKGRYVDDTLAAMDWMEREQGIRSFIMGGLCGGALTGLFAAAKDRRAVSLFGLGIPVILDGAGRDYYDSASEGQLARLREKYLGKLLDPASWLRLVTFRTDFRLLFKSLFRPVLKAAGDGTGEGGGETAAPAAEGEGETGNGNFNRLFPPAFFSMVSARKRILLVFSEKDRLYWEYDEKFYRPYRSRIDGSGDSVEVYVAKDANHIFSFQEWQADMMDKVCSWIRRFP